MTVICPLCHSKYEPPPLDVDLSSNSIIINGVSLKTEPQAAEILSILLDRFPETAPTEFIAARLWGAGDGVVDEKNGVRSGIRRVRVALKNRGWKIVNYYNTGFRLVEARA